MVGVWCSFLCWCLRFGVASVLRCVLVLVLVLRLALGLGWSWCRDVDVVGVGAVCLGMLVIE